MNYEVLFTIIISIKMISEKLTITIGNFRGL